VLVVVVGDYEGKRREESQTKLKSNITTALLDAECREACHQKRERKIASALGFWFKSSYPRRPMVK
jgi:hypothetical protein